MKKWLSIFLFGLFAFHGLQNSLLHLNFRLNQTQIALNQCEFKDMPEMGCQGKCVLKEAIKEHEEQKSENPVQTQNQEVFFCLRPDLKLKFKAPSLVQIFIPKLFSSQEIPLAPPCPPPPEQA